MPPIVRGLLASTAVHLCGAGRRLRRRRTAVSAMGLSAGGRFGHRCHQHPPPFTLVLDSMLDGSSLLSGGARRYLSGNGNGGDGGNGRSSSPNDRLSAPSTVAAAAAASTSATTEINPHRGIPSSSSPVDPSSPISLPVFNPENPSSSSSVPSPSPSTVTTGSNTTTTVGSETTPAAGTSTTTSTLSSQSSPMDSSENTAILLSSSSSSSVVIPSWLDQWLELWKTQSGTSEVLALKETVSRKSHQFDVATTQVTHARQAVQHCLWEWERTNGQHLQLLQRRDTWTASDAQQFAALMGHEVETRKALEEARADLVQAETHSSHCQLDYMNAMRKRYHEEQVWQDQWRVLSTYGTWSLIVLNSIVFLASQFFHYRREARKLQYLETLIQENMASQQAFTETMVAERQAFAESASSSASSASSSTITPSTPIPSIWGFWANATNITDAADELETSSLVSGDVSSKHSNGGPVHPEDDDDEAYDQAEPSATTTITTTQQSLLPEWLETRLQQISWVKSITGSRVWQSSVQKSKDWYHSASKQHSLINAYQSAKTQTKDFFQEELHLPSVMLGASLTGLLTVAVVATTMLLNTKSSGSSTPRR